MTSSSRPFRCLAAGALLGVAGTLAGCLDMSLLSAVAFPPGIAGLDAGQPWVHLPVEAWVQDGDIRAEAMSGCFAAECAPKAAVGIFSARGPGAARLRAVAAHPDRLAQVLLRPAPRRPGGVRSSVPARADAERLRDGDRQGFAIRVARPDGTHAAHGATLLIERGDDLLVVLVVSASGEAARRIVREVAARQS